MKQKKIAIIGGGAAGMAAAIAAADEGACVTIYERNDRLGKKILATGNGKCNLGNRQLSVTDYNSDNLPLVEKCLERFGTQDTVSFFEELGLMIKEKNGYLYPASEQAASVLDVLRLTVERLGIEVVYETKINRIEKKKDGRFTIGWDAGSGQREQSALYDSVILACGGKAAPKTGSDGSGYKLAKQLGIQVTPVVPSLVQLKCGDEFCKSIAGVRADARLHMFCDKKRVTEERGELQLTEYGISGIPVFQLSGQANRLLREDSGRRIEVQVDFVPDVAAWDWISYGEQRIKSAKSYSDMTAESLFTGMLHKKLMTLFLKMAGLKTNALVKDIPEKKLMEVFLRCKCLMFHVTGSNSYENAQVCAGGVSMKEVTDCLEAVSVKGLFFAGEVLDVDGRCGGYNLQWAWTSGYLAGAAAAEENTAENAAKNAAEKAAEKAASNLRAEKKLPPERKHFR